MRDKQINFDDMNRTINGYLDVAAPDAEYLDKFIQYDPRPELFWQFSSTTRQLLEWYPINYDAKVLVQGDTYGSLVGSLAKKAEVVSFCSDNTEQEEIVRKRYSGRFNIRFVRENPSDKTDDLAGKYDYAVLNNHPFPGRELINKYMLGRMISYTMTKIREGGILLALCLRDEIEYLKRSACENGLLYCNVYKPMKIGPYLLEISADDIVDKAGYLEDYRRTNFDAVESFYQNPWIIKYGKPDFGPDEELNEYEEYRSEDADLISQVREVELDLLRQFSALCDIHNLKWYPMYGTLLGTVRRAGYVDDDDDIDVALMREDYNKLISLADEFQNPYFLQTPENDDCFFGGYLKLRNRNTTAIDPQNWWVNCCEGISIDIFPIDCGFSDLRREKRKRFKIKQIQRLLYAKAYGYSAKFKDMKLLVWKAYKYFGKLFTKAQMVRWLDKTISKGDDSVEAPVAIYTHYLGKGGSSRLFQKEDFVQEVRMKYEDVVMTVPAGWNSILSTLYGKNYLKPMLGNKFKLRHGFYHPAVAYEVYKQRFRGLHRPYQGDNKEIVLFGAPIIMEAYMKRYPDKKYRPSRIVLLEDVTKNDIKVSARADDFDRSLTGVSRAVLEDFADIDLSKIYAIICAADVRDAEDILCKIGFNEYWFYWENRKWMQYANISAVNKDVEKLGKSSVYFP